MARYPERRGAPRKPAETPKEDLVKVAGLPAVQALFRQRPDDVERLFYDDALKAEAGPLCKLLAARRKPYRQLPADEMEKVAGTRLHGGIVAAARPRPPIPFDAAKVRGWARAGVSLLLLDGVGNPHNLGAIARSMAFFGLPHLIISGHPAQAAPSGAAHRVAEGGLEWVTVHRADDILAAIAELRRAGYWVAATALGEAARPFAGPPADRPAAIVLGNEEDGLPPATIAACEAAIILPGSGRVQSLNVSATAAILAWELARRG